MCGLVVCPLVSACCSSGTCFNNISVFVVMIHVVAMYDKFDTRIVSVFSELNKGTTQYGESLDYLWEILSKNVC